MVFSHDYQEDSDEDIEQKNSGNKLEDIKEDDNDLKESVNSNLNANNGQNMMINGLKPPQMCMCMNMASLEFSSSHLPLKPQGQVQGGLIKPPAVIN